MVGTKTHSPKWSNVSIVGAVLAFISIPAALAGGIPILGLLIGWLAPNLFLIGIFLIVYGISRTNLSSKISASLVAIFATLVIGLNTRIPAIISDVVAHRPSKIELISRLQGEVGQPIHVITNTPGIAARWHQYAHAIPACYGDGCFVTRGFRTPSPSLGADYWHEDVMNVVLASGFSRAKEEEWAPTLRVTETNKPRETHIHLELKNADGNLLANYDGSYRNGFLGETKDGADSDEEEQPLLFEYLFHGNILSALAEHLSEQAQAYPLTNFLNSAALLSHPQGRALGLEPPGGLKGYASHSTKVALEVLEVKNFDPDWIIKGDIGTGFSKWSELTFDKVRATRCQTLLKPESVGAPLMQTWVLFTNDPTGRKKARYAGDVICDSDAIWFLDYVAESGRVTLTKFAINGDFRYRLSLEKPKPLYGFRGFIDIPTFQAKDGYLQFEWWDVTQSGGDMHVKRIMRVRANEPLVSSTS
ncbi:MAG: hypothetical protein HY018_06555 [Hydrogenophilales bacterium]|nr:hypothetical protein [Hydrogenophilales bacterium]